MIDWREVTALFGPEIEAHVQRIHTDRVIQSCLAMCDGVACLASRDYQRAAESFAEGERLATVALEIDELRRGWRALDRWADDGGRS